MLEEATMSEKDPSLAGMGWMGWDEVNVKIFLKHIDLILTTQEQQGPAPDVTLQISRASEPELTSRLLGLLRKVPTGPPCVHLATSRRSSNSILSPSLTMLSLQVTAAH